MEIAEYKVQYCLHINLNSYNKLFSHNSCNNLVIILMSKNLIVEKTGVMPIIIS